MSKKKQVADNQQASVSAESIDRLGSDANDLDRLGSMDLDKPYPVTNAFGSIIYWKY